MQIFVVNTILRTITAAIKFVVKCATFKIQGVKSIEEFKKSKYLKCGKSYDKNKSNRKVISILSK